MLEFLAILATVVLLVSFNALYVAAEFSTVASRRTRVSQMAAEGNAMARIISPIMEDGQRLDRYVAACQIGITISSLLLGMYGQNVIAERLTERFGTYLAEGTSVIIVLVLITTLQVVFGELLPKSISVQYPERVALALAVPMLASLTLLQPLIWFFNGSGRLILRLMKQEHHEGHGHIHSPQEIEFLVTESHEVGLLDDDERQMLRNAFRLRDLTAKQVMVHRTRMVAASVDMSSGELLELATAEGKSRLPIYEGDIDNILGMIHIKDVFRLYVTGSNDLREIIRDVVKVPDSLPASDVWETLRQRRQYLCIVFDEFGGTAGLITLEDLIEEIFGELQDEFDNEMALMYMGEKGRSRFRGDWLIADMNEYFDLSLPMEADTLSGLVISELGRPPREGDVVKLGDTLIRVEKMEKLGVGEVSIENPNNPKLQNQMLLSFNEWRTPSND